MTTKKKAGPAGRRERREFSPEFKAEAYISPTAQRVSEEDIALIRRAAPSRTLYTEAPVLKVQVSEEELTGIFLDAALGRASHEAASSLYAEELRKRIRQDVAELRRDGYGVELPPEIAG